MIENVKSDVAVKVWFKCPICGQKLLKVDTTKKIEGVYLMCKKCHQEIEIVNNIESKPEPVAI
ncbi:hypothetical protein EXM81_09645 [Clostridium botulinum]|nr:hypothetical protein [Clostridium botulinum]